MGDRRTSCPLDNLDDTIRYGDALFNPWPKVDVIVGNPVLGSPQDGR